MWARATLAQLADNQGMVPVVKITDYPAFPLRGFMHDTGRNYRPVEIGADGRMTEVKNLIYR